MTKRAGLSLAETVVAIFLFVAGGLVCFELLLKALRNSARVEQVTRATLLAETTLARMREWARQPVNYLSNWSIYANQEHTWPEAGGFRVRTFVSATGRDLSSPCSALLDGYPPRTLAGSTRTVRVQVSWGGSLAEDQVELSALIGEPLRQVRSSSALVIRRSGTIVDPVPLNATTTFVASLYDVDNQAIEGAAIEWQPIPDHSAGAPGGGMGTLRPVPGQERVDTVQLLNHFYRGDPSAPLPPESLPGWVSVQGICRYAGGEVEGISLPVRLGSSP